jgi:hypothetical protein
LRIDVAENKRTLDDLKSSNAAVAVLGVQLATLTQAVAEIKEGITNRFIAHDLIHKQDSDARLSGRRWLIAMAIAGITALGGLYGYIGLLIHK